MAIKILIVDKVLDAGASVVGSIGRGEVEVVFIPHGERAINNLRRTEYSVIILGDKLIDHSDCLDVGLALKNSNHNKHTPVVCVGGNKSRRNKLFAMLSPYSYSVDVGNEKEVSACVSRIRDYLNTLVKNG